VTETVQLPVCVKVPLIVAVEVEKVNPGGSVLGSTAKVVVPLVDEAVKVKLNGWPKVSPALVALVITGTGQPPPPLFEAVITTESVAFVVPLVHVTVMVTEPPTDG
jgi:hypothetical protein